jgi:hypothetical protein
MSVKLPNGSTAHISSGFGTAINVTAVTNASTAVATATAHGLANGDYVVFISGWSRASNRTYRVANVTTNTFELEGLDTADTDKYTAGSGTGTVQEVTGWTQIQQILNITSEGGQQNYATFQFLEDDAEQRIPTNKSAAGLNIEVADDPSLAGWIAAVEANDDGDPRAFRVTTKNGSKILYYSYVSANKTPSMDVNQPMRCQISISHLNANPVRYAS